jgi:hypothetical protein
MQMRRVVGSLVALILVSVSTGAFCTTEQDKGASKIELNGGKRGDVSFPHHLHQEKLGDCQICHSIFEQKSGSIQALKSQGKIKKKYVMNKLCTKCHKEKKRAGEKSGPTTCTKCHIKEKIVK